MSNAISRMNALTAFRRRVQSAYKPRTRRNRAAKRKHLRQEIEEARKANDSPIPSPVSMDMLANPAGKNDTGQISESNEDPSESAHSQTSENHITSLQNNAEGTLATPRRQDLILNIPEHIEETTDFQAEPSSLDAADEQAIRERFYVFSTGEEPEDYTYGPVRMVLASDGLRQCCALLLTLDFSAKVQRALRAERDFAKLERSSTRQLRVALKYERALRSEITNHTCRLFALEEEEEPDIAKIASLKEECSILERMFEDSKYDRECHKSLIESKASILRRIQAKANAQLEEAFVCARLLEPEGDEPDTPIEERDLQKEYQMFRQSLEGREIDEPVTPLDDSRDHMQLPPLTAEQQARQDLIDAFWEAHDLFKDAQSAFDSKEHRRAVEWQAHVEAYERGGEPEDATREEFDLRWLKCCQELTRKLMQAEDAFATAKANALEAGIDMTTGDEISVSIDGEDRMSFQEDRISADSEPRVTNWLTSLSTPVSPSYNEQTADTDDWESREVGISDSLSVVAEGAERRRIDEWRRACDD